MVGKVIEVFMPKEYKNGVLLDVMDRNLIGFKVKIEDGMIEVIQEQDDYNVEIRKEDSVVLTETNIDGKNIQILKKQRDSMDNYEAVGLYEHNARSYEKVKSI